MQPLLLQVELEPTHDELFESVEHILLDEPQIAV